ncbi:MAG TPA: rRNA pseudouridine synthase [Cytophagales bacterium]|nr:rRNA pseudouridine synthase [Cytophagales bacterium]
MVSKSPARNPRKPEYDQSKMREIARSKGRDQKKSAETRLNKYIANAGICSRREADDLIAQGMVKVNGKVVTEMGYKVQKGDIVKYQGKTLSGEAPVYLLLNKPKDFITTTSDPQERKTVMELVNAAGEERIFPVGRLDRATTGLLLFTNDGDLAEKLTHPSHQVQKLYEVTLDRPIEKDDFLKLQEGITLEDGFAKPVDVAIVGGGDDRVLGLEIHMGRNRIVRRMMEHLGYSVEKLDRVMYAGLTKKDVSRGQWRYLTEKEVIKLKYFL